MIHLCSFGFLFYKDLSEITRAREQHGDEWQQRLQEQYDGSFYERLQDAWGNEWSTRLDFVLQGNNDAWLIEQIRNESYTLQAGNKRFELSNHLGNVLAVVSDKKVQTDGVVWQAEVVSAQDYFPFGMAMPGRTTDAKHRYGFNGKETDPETGIQDYGMRWYLPNIARFPSVDPITKQYPELTPYQFASNTPIMAIDLDGLEMLVPRSPFPATHIKTVTHITIERNFENITQTGYPANQTPVNRITVSTADGGLYRFVVMGAGLDVDTDGSGGKHGPCKQNPKTTLKIDGSFVNGDKIAYATVPSILMTKYGVAMGSLCVAVGPQKKSNLETQVPCITADNSGDHGGELGWLACTKLNYGVGVFDDNGNDNACNDGNDRVPSFEYWYNNMPSPTTQNGLETDQDVKIRMDIISQTREALKDRTSPSVKAIQQKPTIEEQ